MHPLCESVGPAHAAAPMNEPVADRERTRRAAWGPRAAPLRPRHAPPSLSPTARCPRAGANLLLGTVKSQLSRGRKTFKRQEIARQYSQRQGEWRESALAGPWRLAV